MDPAVFLAAIVEGSEDAIIGETLEGVIVSWNRAAQDIFGWSAGEAIGRPISLIIPRGMEDEELGILARVRDGERVHHYETKRRYKDGRVIDVSLSIGPIRDRSGRVIGAAKIVRDISETKDNTQRMLRHDLGEQRREVERLREMNMFKARFINMAAHELRTPLTPLNVQVHLLKTTLGKGLTPDQVRAIDSLGRNLERLRTLVEDILNAARLQADRLELHPRSIDLAPIVSEAIESFRAFAQQVGVTVRWEPPEVLPVSGDPRRVGQIVYNLLSNALKFTPPGGTVTVEGRRDADVVRLAFRDTGQGIAPDRMDRLFLPFSQAHDAARDSRPGTGLGLYISQGIAEQHGGRIDAQSAGSGQGATFTLTLPATDEPVERAAAKIPAPPLEVPGESVLINRLKDLI